VGGGGELFLQALAYQDKLLELYATCRTSCCRRSGSNEVASFVRGGLQDLSISRTTFDWGVKVPGDPRHVMYVWVDALTNYITAVDYPDTQSPKFKKSWPCDLHVIGKDIVRFHAVYWPAFLMSAGIAVPRRIFSTAFCSTGGKDVEVGR
jgi:methionyl-tRNA synthetase